MNRGALTLRPLAPPFLAGDPGMPYVGLVVTYTAAASSALMRRDSGAYL